MLDKTIFTWKLLKTNFKKLSNMYNLKEKYGYLPFTEDYFRYWFHTSENKKIRQKKCFCNVQDYEVLTIFSKYQFNSILVNS